MKLNKMRVEHLELQSAHQELFEKFEVVKREAEKVEKQLTDQLSTLADKGVSVSGLAWLSRWQFFEDEGITGNGWSLSSAENSGVLREKHARVGQELQELRSSHADAKKQLEQLKEDLKRCENTCETLVTHSGDWRRS